jgi:hypothetical protein
VAILTAATVLSLIAQYPDWSHDKALWLAFKESGYDAAAINPAGPYYGLFQIGAPEGRGHGATPEQLLDPATNVRVAHALYQERGWSPWPIAASYPEASAVTLGVDISNYSGHVSTQQMDCWEAQGVRRVVIGLQNAGIARQQQSMCGRFERQYYVERPGRDLTIPEAGAMVWVDIEPGAITTIPDLNRSIQEIVAAKLAIGFYGNETSIRPIIGDSNVLAPWPLWYASYFNNRVPSLSEFKPFNGWQSCAMWQYRGTTDLCGVNVDLNVYEAAAIPVEVPSTDDQIDALSAEIRRVLDFKYGRLPLKDLSERQDDVFQWLAEKERNARLSR